MFLFKKSICLGSTKDASVILTAGTPPSTTSGQPANSRSRLRAGQEKHGVAKSRAPARFLGQKLQETQQSSKLWAGNSYRPTAPQLPGKYLVRTKNTHYKQSKRFRNRLFIKNVWEVCTGNARYNCPSNPLFLLQYIIYFKTMTMPSLFRKSQVKETWMSE